MQVDTEFLQRHYSSLSDEALLDVNRADLVEAARKCYDAEVAGRELAASNVFAAVPIPREAGTGFDEDEDSGKPEWLDESAEVYSEIVVPGRSDGRGAAHARHVLEAEGIPCYLELFELPAEDHSEPAPTHAWRLVVPGDLNLRSTSVLDRDIFNPQFEGQWKNHLEAFSDDELREMSPQAVFCGLFDRVARVTRAWNEELARRGLEG